MYERSHNPPLTAPQRLNRLQTQPSSRDIMLVLVKDLMDV